MWPFRVLPLLIVLFCAGVADADPARITGGWSYEIVEQNGNVTSNGGSFAGIGELNIFGSDPAMLLASVSFDITTTDVRLQASFLPAELSPCFAHPAPFGISNGSVAISGTGRGCALAPSTNDQSAQFGMTASDFDIGDVSFPGDESLIAFIQVNVEGQAQKLSVSEPADFGFLALSACLAALYGFRRRQLS
jgi:hypothetical protein